MSVSCRRCVPRLLSVGKWRAGGSAAITNLRTIKNIKNIKNHLEFECIVCLALYNLACSAFLCYGELRGFWLVAYCGLPLSGLGYRSPYLLRASAPISPHDKCCPPLAFYWPRSQRVWHLAHYPSATQESTLTRTQEALNDPRSSRGRYLLFVIRSFQHRKGNMAGFRSRSRRPISVHELP
jgi:hypothetical protein